MNIIIEKIPIINQQLQLFNSSINVLINKQNEYGNSIKRYSNKNYNIQIDGNVTLEKKEELETMMDQLEDINTRSSLMLEDVNEFLEKTIQLKQNIEEMKQKYLKIKEFSQEKLKSFAESLVEYCNNIQHEEIKKNPQNTDNTENKVIEEIFLLKSQYDKYTKHEKLDEILKENEIKQLQQWTGKKCREIMFDSNHDNWAMNTSVFNDKIVNTKELTFIIKDTKNNIFGYYLSTENGLDKCDSWIETNCDTFLFSLRSNGRIKEMMKFEIKNINNGCLLKPNADNVLISLGSGSIYLYKKNCKEQSCCYQHKQSHFDYHGINNALCGSHKFKPKRIIVIEMK